VADLNGRRGCGIMLTQVHFEDEGSSCRIGYKAGRPWSGVTAVVDFCTHSHKDTNNMNNGCTTVSLRHIYWFSAVSSNRLLSFSALTMLV